MILQSIPRVILTRMSILIARSIIFLILPTITFLNRSAKATRFIFLAEADLMKHHMLQEILLHCCIRRALIMNWTFGGRNGHTSGIHGEKRCQNLLKEYDYTGTDSTVALIPLSV